jgi:amino acid permease
MDGYARMADDLLGPWAGLWIRLAVLVDFTATCIGFTVAASRGIFSLARSGLLPKGLASTNRQGAPKAAGIVVLWGAMLVSTLQNKRNNYLGVHESSMHPNYSLSRRRSRA